MTNPEIAQFIKFNGGTWNPKLIKELEEIWGTEIECDCHECESVIVGEERCKCGNHKIYFITEECHNGEWMFFPTHTRWPGMYDS